MSVKHNGIHEFSPTELTAATLGQGGFKIATNGEFVCGTTSGWEDIKYIVAIKAISGDAVIQGKQVNPDGRPGDDFAKGGSYDHSTSGNDITVLDGDTVYGAFEKISVNSGDYVQCFIGR